MKLIRSPMLWVPVGSCVLWVIIISIYGFIASKQSGDTAIADILKDEKRWHEFSPDDRERENILDQLRAAAYLTSAPICTFKKGASSGDLFHSTCIWLISMSQDQFVSFQERTLKYEAQTIAPKDSFNHDIAIDTENKCPAWWDPPEIEGITWGPSHQFEATYDKGRELLFFRSCQ